MGYDLHIERPGDGPDSDPAPISLAEWFSAVASMKGVRLVTVEAHTITNPKTGEVISISTGEGDVEVYDLRSDQWRAAFRWFDGSAAFRASFEPGDSEDPVWAAAAMLARHLGAVIRGDEGETYDLETGSVAR